MHLRKKFNREFVNYVQGTFTMKDNKKMIIQNLLLSQEYYNRIIKQCMHNAFISCCI